MALNLKYSVAYKNSRLDAINTQIGASGLMRWYDGTQPTNPDTAISTQVKLAELTLSSTAFAAASSGIHSANTITADASADATGTATWGTFTTSTGGRVADFSIGTATADLILNTVSVVSGAQCSCSSYTITAGN